MYDLVGKIQQVTDPTATYAFACDNMGRLIGTTTQYTFLPGHNFQNSYSSDAASNRASLTAPDGSTNTYNGACPERSRRNALGRRTQLTRPNRIKANYSLLATIRFATNRHATTRFMTDSTTMRASRRLRNF